jgi:hypothetical protein
MSILSILLSLKSGCHSNFYFFLNLAFPMLHIKFSEADFCLTLGRIDF